MLKKITPQFLTTLDAWLLKNQPLIWRTRIHYVLFYCLLVQFTTFVVFHLVQLTTGNMPGEDSVTYFRYAMLTLGGFGLIAWGFSSLKIPIKSHRFSHFLFTGLLYWVGVAAICSTVWCASKAMDNKLAGLVEDQVSNEDYQSMLRAIEYNYHYPLMPLGDILHIWDMDFRYQVAGNFLEDNTELGITMDNLFQQKYGYSFREFSMLARDKIQIIHTAKANRDLLTVSSEYLDIYWLFLIGLTLLPMLALLLSIIDLRMAISLGFAQFLALVGIVLLSMNDSNYFEEYYYVLTLFLCLLVTILRFNHKVVHWLQLFTAISIPIAMLVLLNEGSLRQLFENRAYFISQDLMLTVVTTVLVSFMSYAYFKRRNRPQAV